MANVNSSAGWSNLPVQSIVTGTETALVVPAATLYQGLPSPTLAAGVGLPLILDPDAQTNNPTATTPTYINSSIDGKTFRVRLTFLVTTGGAFTLIPRLYRVSASTIAAGTQGTLANDSVLAVGATFTAGAAGTFNYTQEFTFLWDSSSAILNGYFNSLANGTFTGSAATTQRTAVAYPDINFIPSFIFGTANAANAIQVKEFLFEKV